MSKFKKGDVVKIVDQDGGGSLGQVLTVKTVDGDYCSFTTSPPRWLLDKRLELVRAADWRPKVGDRVRVADNMTPAGIAIAPYSVGQDYPITGTCKAAGGGTGYLLSGHYQYLRIDQIEPAAPVAAEAQPAAPLKIEAGRYYRTRDGRKVGPMKAYVSERWPDEKWSDGNWTYRDDGTWGGKDGSQPDLIAEWVEPAAPPTVKPIVAATVDYQADEYGSGVRQAEKPKFKVGDKVRHKDLGYEGHIKAVIDETTVDTFWPSVGWGGRDPLESLDLISPANDNAPVAQQAAAKFKVGDVVTARGPFGGQKRGKIAEVDEKDSWLTYKLDDGCWVVGDSVAHITQPTAIVARIDNGQPKPNPVPFVHHSQEAAAIEAARLANKHKGQKFGVYVLTGEPAFVEKPAYAHEWQRLAANGNKIAAIRELRGLTGIGLHPAKVAVDQFVTQEAA